MKNRYGLGAHYLFFATVSLYTPHIARDFEYRSVSVAAIAWWPVDPRRSRAVSIIHAPGPGHFRRRLAITVPS